MKNIFQVLALIILIYTLSTLHIRVDHANQQRQAWYVQLPGWGEMGHNEDTVDLSLWVGSGITGLTTTVDGVENAELNAAVALQAKGVYGPEYKPVQLASGHWILYRPASVEKYFTLFANYRVSPYFQVK